MKLKKLRKTKKGRIEIIPMIDVMFFLLATFMLASLAMQQINSIPLNLPKGKAQSSSIENNITISIDANNNIYINKQLSNDSNFSRIIKPLLNNNDKPIIISADKNCQHGTVVATMLKAKDNGAKNFSIVIEQQ